MRGLVIFAYLIVPAIFALGVTDLRADAECFRGYRDTTADERAAMTAVLQNALRALPPAPEGWVLVSDDSLYVRPSVCRDDEAEPWSVQFSRDYQRIDDLDERNKILDEAGAKMKASMQAKQPRIDAVMARVQALSAAAVAAAEKGDFAKVDALNIELEQATAEMEQIMAEGGTFEQLDAANEEASRDRSLRIAVVVNPSHESLGAGAERMSVPPSAEQAYRWRETRGDVTDETALLLFGRWQSTGDAMAPVSRPNAAPTAAQAISVRITADETRMQSVLDAIDFEALAASLAR